MDLKASDVLKSRIAILQKDVNQTEADLVKALVREHFELEDHEHLMATPFMYYGEVVQIERLTSSRPVGIKLVDGGWVQLKDLSRWPSKTH